MAIVNNTQSIQAGVQAALMETWRQKYPIYQEQQDAFLHHLPYTPLRKAPYVFKDRVPMVLPLPYNKNRVHQVFKDRKIDITLQNYDLTISWDSRDASDDILKDLKIHAAQGVKRFLQLPDILFTEYLTGVPVYNMGGLANAFDGVGLFSALDGSGSARFGVTGGNIITGQGVNTTAQVQNDIILVRRRFLQMLEPVTGQPLHDPDDVTYNRMLFIIPPQLDGIFSQISEQELIYADPSINTAQSGLLKGKIKYKVNQRLSDVNDWHVIVKTDFWKPFAYRAPQTPRQFFATMQNSDVARETFQESVYCDLRTGLTPWATWTAIKVSNS